MKNFTLMSLALMLLAVGCVSQSTQKEGNTINPTTVTPTENYDGIVYIDSDSLVRGYQMFKDLSAEFAKKADKVQQELNNKLSSFDAEVKSFQNKVNKGLITRYEAQQKGEELDKERNVLLQYREEQLASLQEQEMVMTNNISENVRIYIEKYNETKKYKMIINTSAATSVIVAADPQLDITTEVLEGLNREYTPAKK